MNVATLSDAPDWRDGESESRELTSNWSTNSPMAAGSRERYFGVADVMAVEVWLVPRCASLVVESGVGQDRTAVVAGADHGP